MKIFWWVNFRTLVRDLLDISSGALETHCRNKFRALVSRPTGKFPRIPSVQWAHVDHLLCMCIV